MLNTIYTRLSNHDDKKKTSFISLRCSFIRMIFLLFRVDTEKKETH